MLGVQYPMALDLRFVKDERSYLPTKARDSAVRADVQAKTAGLFSDAVNLVLYFAATSLYLLLLKLLHS